MRLPRNYLKQLSEVSGLNRSYLSGIITRKDSCSPKKAIQLEAACKTIGLNVPKELWVFGTSNEIKQALTNMAETETK